MMKLMATFLIGCTVAIGALTLEQVHSIKIRSSWKELTDTGTLELPLLKGLINPTAPQESLADSIRVGDRVTIDMSYTQGERVWKYREFSGYVKKVSPEVPLKVELEDDAFLFRRRTLANRSFTNTNPVEIINYIVGQVNQDATFPVQLYGSLPREIRETIIPKFRISNANGLEALDKLRSELGLAAYFRNQTLYVGLPYTEFSEVNVVKYDLSLNVADSKLTWLLPGDTDYRVKYTAITKDNQKIEVTFPEGKETGELVSETTYKVSDADYLKKMAEATYNKIKAYEGYEGSITAFLVPFVQHGDTVDLLDPDYPARRGKYSVDEVVTEFGKGISRTITLGKRLDG